MNYKDWAIADKKDEGILIGLGIILGKYNEKDGCSDNCIVSVLALDWFDPYWGYFTWGLPND